MPFRLTKEWARQKPPLGSQVNWGHPLAWGLVGCWLFNEGGGKRVTDIARLNQGAWNGTGSNHWSAGKFGMGGKFNGSDDYVDAGNATPLQFTVGTLAAWVNFSSLTSYGIIVGKDDFNAGLNGYSFGQHSSKIYLELASASTFQDTSGVTTLLANTWYFMAATWDGAKVKLYLNGVQDVSVNQTLTPVSTVWNFAIGKSQVYGLGFVPGLIDSVFAYNRALTGSEIWQLYTNPFCMVQTPRRRIISGTSAVTYSPLLTLMGVG